jgi:hypothetical protein
MNMIFSAKESTGVIEVMDIGTGSLIYAIPVPPTYGRFFGPAHLVDLMYFSICLRQLVLYSSHAFKQKQINSSKAVLIIN